MNDTRSHLWEVLKRKEIAINLQLKEIHIEQEEHSDLRKLSRRICNQVGELCIKAEKALQASPSFS